MYTTLIYQLLSLILYGNGNVHKLTRISKTNLYRTYTLYIFQYVLEFRIHFRGICIKL